MATRKTRFDDQLTTMKYYAYRALKGLLLFGISFLTIMFILITVALIVFVADESQRVNLEQSEVNIVVFIFTAFDILTFVALSSCSANFIKYLFYARKFKELEKRRQ